MSITGIESLRYGVGDVAESTRFFTDFGLTLLASGDDQACFSLQDGSRVEIRHRDDPSLPASGIVGDGVREVVWAVDSEAALDRLAADLGRDHAVTRDADGTAHFVADFGVAMALRVFRPTPLVSAPEPVNAPGRINRLNTHRRWRRRAHPKLISHVVFAVPDYDRAQLFMRERLSFRVSDVQKGFGHYLRAPGSFNHHSVLFLNAHAPLPENDGSLRFHHANFGVDDIDEIMTGANYMARKGWEPSHFGLGRHRIDSALFYYLPCPAGGEAEYGADTDYIDDSWVPRHWVNPLFAYAQFVHNLPPFLLDDPEWRVEYLVDGVVPAGGEAH